MNFNLDTNVKPKETMRDIMPVGVNHNCTLTACETRVSQNNKTYLHLEWTNADQQTISHTEWPIDPTRVNPKNNESPEDASKRILNMLLERLMHICNAYVGEGNTNINAVTFEDLAKGIANHLAPYVDKTDKTVSLRLQYDYRDFVALYPYPPFIRATGEGEELKSSSRDKLVRTADVAVANGSENTDDLPF